MTTVKLKANACPTAGGSGYAFAVEVKFRGEEKWHRAEVAYPEDSKLRDRSSMAPVFSVVGLLTYDVAMHVAYQAKANHGHGTSARLIPHFVEYGIKATETERVIYVGDFTESMIVDETAQP